MDTPHGVSLNYFNQFTTHNFVSKYDFGRVVENRNRERTLLLAIFVATVAVFYFAYNRKDSN